MINIEQPIKDEVKAQRLMYYKVEMSKIKLNIIAFEAIGDQNNVEVQRKELENWEKIYIAVEASE